MSGDIPTPWKLTAGTWKSLPEKEHHLQHLHVWVSCRFSGVYVYTDLSRYKPLHMKHIHMFDANRCVAVMFLIVTTVTCPLPELRNDGIIFCNRKCPKFTKNRNNTTGTITITTNNSNLTKPNQILHPWKQTWNLKMPPWKRRNIYQAPFFGFHVSFRRCKQPNLAKSTIINPPQTAPPFRGAGISMAPPPSFGTWPRPNSAPRRCGEKGAGLIGMIGGDSDLSRGHPKIWFSLFLFSKGDLSKMPWRFRGLGIIGIE